MSDTLERLASIALTVLLVMFSAIVHEVAHGLAALACGDPTAKEHGRLTLNPAAHLDGFGSVLLPLVMALLGGPVFAFAKPVPGTLSALRPSLCGRKWVLLRLPRGIVILCTFQEKVKTFRFKSAKYTKNQRIQNDS